MSGYFEVTMIGVDIFDFIDNFLIVGLPGGKGDTGKPVRLFN